MPGKDTVGSGSKISEFIQLPPPNPPVPSDFLVWEETLTKGELLGWAGDHGLDHPGADSGWGTAGQPVPKRTGE